MSATNKSNRIEHRAFSPLGRISLHLQAWSHHPRHYRFHLAGITRECNETGASGLIAACAWIGFWFLIIL